MAWFSPRRLLAKLLPPEVPRRALTDPKAYRREPLDPAAISVVPARSEHFAEIGRMSADIYVNEGYALPSQRKWLEDVAGRAGHGAMFVALEAGRRVLGSVMLAKPPSPLSELSGPGEADVRLLIVARFARGQGVGSALMRAVIARGREESLTALVLWTQATMESAQRMYERLGFKRFPALDKATPVRTFLTYRYEL